ncbi:MAG: 50S ribosomal protein L18e [Nanoarchaeota archaeon]
MKKSSLSLTKIKNKARRKTNPELFETISLARRNFSWLKLAHVLSGPTNKFSSINLGEIDEKAKEGDTILIPGKVLSSGDISKKVRIVALSISSSAKDKLKKTKSEFATILQEIKINPKANGLKVMQ